MKAPTMTPPSPIQPDSPSIPWYRRRAAAAVGVVVTFTLVGAGFAAVAGHGADTGNRAQIAAIPTSSSPLPVDTCGGGLCNVTPAEEPAADATTPASGPWTPCAMDEDDAADSDAGCADVTEDACDGAYEAKQNGELLDVLIEDKDLIDAKRFNDCPQFLPAWRTARAGFTDGDQDVGADIKAGTYETTGRVSDCYWERIGKNGRTIANDFVTAAKKITVTIRTSDEIFTSDGCGDWVPA